MELPDGYRVVVGGEYEEQQSTFGSLGVILLLAQIGIFAVLVLQFRSILQPLVVFAAIPLAISGSFIALYITGWSFSFTHYDTGIDPFDFIRFWSMVALMLDDHRRETISNFKGLSVFIKDNNLWQVVLKYTWLSKFLLMVGLVGSFSFIHFVYDYWSDNQTALQINTAGFTSALDGFFSEGYDLFVLGGLKYVILILMEVIIFHFARRTLEVKTG